MRNKQKTLSLPNILQSIKRQESFDQNSIELLISLIKTIRPKPIYKTGFAEIQLRKLTQFLKNDAVLLSKFRELFSSVFHQSDITEVITNSGILEENGFFSELNRRFSHKFLPPLKQQGSFLSVIDTIFYSRKDYIWVQDVSNLIWEELFECIGFNLNMKDPKVRLQISQALSTISFHIASLSLERIIRKYYKASEADDPFVLQSQTIQELIRRINRNENFNELKELLPKLLYECEQVLSSIRKLSITRGTSVKLTHTLLQLSQYINRIYLTLTFLGDENIDYKRITNQFKLIIENENTKNSIKDYLRGSIGFLAYRIAEHERNTGEHYITTTSEEYKAMLKSAMKGGFIISFIVVIKSLFHYVKFAPFWQGFAYSINYATGFLLIHSTGSTLATKQPAMTASAIASSIDRKDKHVDMARLAILISRVIRSQTASFIGNLIIVFPLALLFALIFDKLFGFSLAHGEVAQSMIDAQNPLKSLCLLYACFTGFFLFLSGIISGYFDNLVLYEKIPQRIKLHPFLKRILSPNKLDKVANYIQNNLGAFMGNLTLGFFLGMASFVGYIFGIPFDIRHITISTGYYAIGLYGLNFHVSFSDFFFSGLGVLLIGFFNFLISFSLAFMVALASRKIKFNRYRSLGKYIYWLFKKYPRDFIFPPKKTRVASDFLPLEKKEAKQ